MVTHCLRLPSSPTFSLCSSQEYQEELVSYATDDADKHNDEVDFKQWLAEFREELRADRNKILDEMRKDFSLFKEIWGNLGYFARYIFWLNGFILATSPDYLLEIMD